MYLYPLRWHGGAVVSAVASQQKGPRFQSESEHFCAEFGCSPHVRVGLLRKLMNELMDLSPLIFHNFVNISVFIYWFVRRGFEVGAFSYSFHWCGFWSFFHV